MKHRAESDENKSIGVDERERKKKGENRGDNKSGKERSDWAAAEQRVKFSLVVGIMIWFVA